MAVLLAVPAFATESVQGATAAQATSITDANSHVYQLVIYPSDLTGTQMVVDGAIVGHASWLDTLLYWNHTVYWGHGGGATWYKVTSLSPFTTVNNNGDPRQQSANCTGTVWCEDFNSLDVGQHNDTSHTWQYVDTWGPAWDGEMIGSTWEVNELNPATNIPGIYATASGLLNLTLLPKPGSCTACGTANSVGASLWTTTHKVTVGHYVECKVKLLPNINHTTTACWLYGDQTGPSGAYQELDMLESPRAHDGSWSLISQAIHRGDVANGKPKTDIGDTNPYYQFSASFDSNFHTYGVYWTATQICNYIDRVQTRCEATPAGYDSPMWISLGLGDSGNWEGTQGYTLNPADLPATAQFDYIADYDHKPF